MEKDKGGTREHISGRMTGEPVVEVKNEREVIRQSPVRLSATENAQGKRV